MRPWFVILKQVQDDERVGNSGDKCVIPEITRSATNAVAPAKAGAYDVCLARSTGAIGPSLRWGDGNFGNSRNYTDNCITP
jgi:hypothetical protein